VTRRQRTGLTLLILGIVLAIRANTVEYNSNLYVGLQIAMWAVLIMGTLRFTDEDE
jgi:hypothetical protein